jgi:methylglutaconyl-CoA hydratase
MTANDSDELVHLDVTDGIATVTLDSPSNRNALSRRLLAELAEHVASVRDDPAARALLLTATGTVFCAGADLKDPPGSGSDGGVSFPSILTTLWNYPKTVVLRLNGHVRAGGIGLVAAADIVVAPSTANFAFTEVRIGVAPAVISVLCARRMTPRAAARYMLTGETFDAAAASAAGLVTIAVEPEELETATAAVLDAVKLTEPNAVAETKRLLVELPSMQLGEAFVHTDEVSQRLFESEAAAEGIAAFRERRPPSWAT